MKTKKVISTITGSCLAFLMCIGVAKAAIITRTDNTLLSTRIGQVTVNHSTSFNTGTNERWSTAVNYCTAHVANGAYGTGQASVKAHSENGHKATVTVRGTLWFPSGVNAYSTATKEYEYTGGKVVLK